METRKMDDKNKNDEIKPYDSNVHKQMILKEIALFEEKYQAFQAANYRSGILALATVSMMLIQIQSNLIGSIGYGIAGGVVHEIAMPRFFPSRDTVKQVFRDELDKLTCIYAWCCQNGPKVTSDDTFIKLLRTISPFVPREILFPNHFQSLESCKFLSKEYGEILSSPPHNFFIPKLIQTSTSDKSNEIQENKSVKSKTNLTEVEKKATSSGLFSRFFGEKQEEKIDTTKTASSGTHEQKTISIEQSKLNVTKSFDQNVKPSAHQPKTEKQISRLLGIFASAAAQIKQFCHGYSTVDEAEEVVSWGILKK